ncbi:hypothetical protein BDZ97DRAFT_1616973, partial [Flammula alnicola]
DILLSPHGLVKDDEGDTLGTFCIECHRSLKNEKTPALSLANHNYLGPIPKELKELTVVEEAMIAKCRSKCWIIQLKESNENIVLPNVQRGVKGHIIVYPQKTSDIARVLPPSLDDMLTPICVVFVGSQKPSQDWLRKKARPL